MCRALLALLSSCAASCVLLAFPAQAADAQQGCTAVTTQSLAITGLVITGSKMQEAGDGLPRHCIVTGAVDDRTGVDGKHYAIDFEMRLPVEWNGRFLAQENGGGDGAVKPAIGDEPKALASGGAPALARALRSCPPTPGIRAPIRPTLPSASQLAPPSAWIPRRGSTTATKPT